MRNGSTPTASLPSSSVSDGYTIEEIQHHYWRDIRKDDVGSDTTLPQHSTLNASADTKGSLSHMLLFHGANPRWESDGLIFVKSNLDILPHYHEVKVALSSTVSVDPQAETPEKPNEHLTDDNEHRNEDVNHVLNDEPPIEITPSEELPIACFEQGPRSLPLEGFIFAGYYNIQHIALLAPFSAALARMLEQKWTASDKRGYAQVTKRRMEDWKKSLSYEWAVVKFVKMKGENVPPQPKLEKLLPRERKPFKEQTPKKSVNELLAEMRLGKSADDVAENQQAAKSSATSASFKTDEIYRVAQ
jgi:hypothetical protein